MTKVLTTIKDDPPDIKNFKKDKLLFILNFIHTIPANNKRNGITYDGFTKVYSSLIQSYVHDYRLYLNYLLAEDFILTDGFYIIGEKSTGYKIHPKYNDPITISYIKDRILIKNIRKKKRKQKRENKKNIHLSKWMDGLEIDFDAALEYIKRQYEYRMSNPRMRDWDEKNNRYKNPVIQYNCALINIYNIRDKNYNFFIDTSVGRLHTNLTNMSGEIRKFITYKGQKLLTADISNSQPYLSPILFELSFYTTSSKSQQKGLAEFSSLFKNEKVEIDEIKTKNVKIINQIQTNKINYHPTLMSAKPTHITDIEHITNNNTNDLILYTQLVKYGQLYEYLGEVFQTEINKTFSDRKKVKKEVLLIFYSDNRFIGQRNAACKRIFKKHFPNVYEIFATFKKHDKRILPRLLQRIEAHLILDIICKRIHKENPLIPLYTIHDSISTTQQHFEYVKKVMSEELTKYIGISPTFKTELWDQSELKNDYRILMNNA
jgi:hypothetical protein